MERLITDKDIRAWILNSPILYSQVRGNYTSDDEMYDNLESYIEEHRQELISFVRRKVYG